MRKSFMGTVALTAILALPCWANAQDEAYAIVEKAIKAHGGAERLNKFKATEIKTKGKLEILGMTLQFTQESFVFAPKIKEVMNLNINGMQITQVVVYNGQKGWVSAMGNTIEMDDSLLGLMKQGTYLSQIGKMTPLLDKKKFELSLLGESKLGDQTLVGVKVKSEGQKEVNFYFDKQTYLLAKVEHRTLDYMTKQEVDEERILSDYRDVNGLKEPKKAVVRRDNKDFLTAEVLEVKQLEKIDDSEFEKP